MKQEKQFFVAQEDTDVFNVFSYDDFDEDGNYLLNNNEGYNIEDFDVVFESSDFNECHRWIDVKLGYEI